MPSKQVTAVGDFRIDLDHRMVFLRDKQVDLAAAEFDLLVSW